MMISNDSNNNNISSTTTTTSTTSSSSQEWSYSEEEEALFKELQVSFPHRRRCKRADAIRRSHAISRQLRSQMNRFKRQANFVSLLKSEEEQGQEEEILKEDAQSVKESLKAMEGFLKMVHQSQVLSSRRKK